MKTPYPIYRPLSLLERFSDGVGLNTWFTRPLHQVRTDVNPDFQPRPGKLISPCESKLEIASPILEDGMVPDKPLWGKERSFSLKDILRDEDFSPFIGGSFLKLYLAPTDLHYLVSPTDMTLKQGRYIPGGLLPLLFCRTSDVHNERLVLLFETAAGFPLALVMVASLLVAGMACYVGEGAKLRQGEKFAHFRIGSMVLLCLPPDVLHLHAEEGKKLLLGEVLGDIRE